MKQKKDILFLCQFFHPEYISSAQLPYETVQALRESGLSAGVMCGYPHEYYKGEPVPMKDNSEGFYIHRLRYIQTKRSGFVGRLINYFSFTIAVLLHLFEIGQYRAVAVYSNPPILPWIAAMASRLFGTKLVFICYDAYPEVAVRMGVLREGSLIFRFMDHINRLVFKRADAVVALSSEMKDFLATNRPIDADKIHVIPNWSNDLFKPKSQEATGKFENIQSKFVVSYFGNMGTAQDMDTILDAVHFLKDDPNIHFLFAGHGNKKSAIQSKCEEESISNITILDFLQGREFEDALAVSDTALVSLEDNLSGICVPSKTYTYMMYGLPILAVMNDCDIVSDLHSGAGIRVRKGQARELASAIRDLADNPGKAQTMGQRSRALFLDKYTRSICTGEYVRIFKMLLH